MSMLTLIISSALTTGTLMGPGGARIADEPLAASATIAVLSCAVLMSLASAWQLQIGQRFVPPGPTLPKVRRRFGGPNVRRH